MNPYLAAFEAYHADGDPFIPWTEAVDFHFQHGTIFSTSSLFLMARPIPRGIPLEEHPTLTAYLGGTTWHIWSAAGDLREMLHLPATRKLHPGTLITYQRGARDARIRAVALRHLFSRT